MEMAIMIMRPAEPNSPLYFCIFDMKILRRCLLFSKNPPKDIEDDADDKDENDKDL